MRILLTVVICLLLSTGKAQCAEAIVMDGVAAYVNDHVVAISEVLVVLQGVQRSLASKYQGERLTMELRKSYKEALSSVIDRKLIMDSYAEQEMQIPQWLVDKRIDEIISDSFDGDRSKLMRELSRERMTFDEWSDEIKGHIIVSAMREANVNQNLVIAPTAVRNMYNKDPGKYSDPEKVKLRMIVLEIGEGGKGEVQSKKLEADILRRIRAGEDFAELARKHSSGSRADAGGDWGWIEPTMLRRELVELTKTLTVEGVAEASTILDDEIYILKVEGRKRASEASFDAAQNRIERILMKEEADRLYQEWIARLRSTAYIKVVEVDLF